jgi:hypothetical protein
MDFSKCKMQKVASPPLIVLYGGPGIGKTSFGIGSDSSSGYQIGRENHLLVNVDFKGTDRLACNRATDALGHPIKSMSDLKIVFQTLAEGDNPFDWVVFDDLTTIEEIFVREVCEDNNVTELGKVEYGRGFELARVRWHSFFTMIKELQAMKKIGIILIGHTKIESIKDPMSESYSRHDLQLDKRSQAIIKKEVELIGFAHKIVLTKEIDSKFGSKEKIAVGKAERVITFAPDIEGFESKDRFHLPEEISLDWSVFITELNKSLNKENVVKKNKEKK